MKNARTFLVFAPVALLLAGCADSPSLTNSDAVNRTDLPTVSLCYAGQTTTREALAALAMENCPDGTSAVQVWDHDTFFNDCPISKKNRVTYQCLAN